MAVDPKLINAAVLSQRAYNSAVASLAASQKAIATITARGGTATAAQTAALTAAQNAVATSSTEVKSAQMAVNAATNSVAVAAGSTGKAVSPAVDSAVKQAKPYNVQTTTGTGPTMSSTDGLLNIAGAAALALAVANPTGTARLVGSLFSSAKDILGVGGTTSNTKVVPAADPSQYPAYDDNGNLMPGFAVNQEDGGTYYKGFDSVSQKTVPLSAAEQAMLDANEPVGRNNDLVNTSSDPNTNVGADTPRAERIGQVDAATDPNTNVGTDTPRERLETGLLTLDDPYYGLTSAQLQDLGGADPTDPYIRARLGIPQLPGSELEATPGFGTIKTGIPLIDNALSFLGNLFGGKSTKPSVTQSGTTTGEPEPTPNTSEIAQDALKIKSEDIPLTDDEDQNLQNIVGAQGEIVRAEENMQANNRSILANEESQAGAQEQQRQAQAIIDQNNAELADENLPDDRRAELEANNAAQLATIAENAAVIDQAQTNIDNATANNERQQASIQTNLGVIAENSDAFTANSNELGAPVVADNDPETAVDQNFLDANAEVQSETTLTILSEEETNALFDGAEPGLVDSFVEVDETVTELTEEETAALFDGTDTELIVTDVTDLAEPVDPDADPELLGDPEFQDGEITDLVEPVDPDADPELEELGDPDLQLTDLAEPVDPDAEPELEELGDPDLQLTDLAEPVDPATDPNTNVGNETETAALVEPTPVPLTPAEQAILDANEPVGSGTPDPVDPASDPNTNIGDDGTTGNIQDQINDQNAANQAAAKDNAITQATLQARYKQVATADWRVRLQLAPGANYLYKNESGNGAATGILAPLYATDGVIFPYTPSIETSYNASYETYDLTHSNFRGYFYKNSKVNDINIRAVFTAQDTQEANYLLAVIHFFRSVTKMFYGAKDPYRGAPPPLTYLSGFGQHQFNQHPCLVQSFNYSLPNEVDYIRAEAPNNYGESMLTQRSRTGPIAPNPGSPSLTRLFGTATKPPPGALKTPPAPGMVTSNVNNLLQATYVPTKIEISLVLLPVNTRSQVSQQFNMQGFASGALLKGGFW